MEGIFSFKTGIPCGLEREARQRKRNATQDSKPYSQAFKH